MGLVSSRWLGSPLYCQRFFSLSMLCVDNVVTDGNKICVPRTSECCSCNCCAAAAAVVAAVVVVVDIEGYPLHRVVDKTIISLLPWLQPKKRARIGLSRLDDASAQHGFPEHPCWPICTVRVAQAYGSREHSCLPRLQRSCDQSIRFPRASMLAKIPTFVLQEHIRFLSASMHAGQSNSVCVTRAWSLFDIFCWLR